ncbi:hypothetical protein OYE22_27520 [Streptomyces sp. 71268]|nr:hypothetical protein [Streptomyces sp. 71268]WEV28519.1 hypothetical protein OYE22_27520 [Streptomyces sp. 71268]
MREVRVMISARSPKAMSAESPTKSATRELRVAADFGDIDREPA